MDRPNEDRQPAAPPLDGIARELEELGVKPKLTQENAEKQWQIFAREYRIVGDKAAAFAVTRRDMVVAIMVGDVEVLDTAAGVSVVQHVRRPQGGGPSEITYNAPGARQVAAGGTDVVTATTRWVRVAAALSGHTEGALTLWLAGHDHSVMEMIVQLFLTA